MPKKTKTPSPPKRHERRLQQAATVDQRIERIARMPEVEQAIGVHRATIRRWVREGTFPPPLRLGVGRRAAVGWKISAVDAWLEDREAAARPAA